jgi:hypothetical protein
LLDNYKFGGGRTFHVAGRQDLSERSGLAEPQLLCAEMLEEKLREVTGEFKRHAALAAELPFVARYVLLLESRASMYQEIFRHEFEVISFDAV